MPLNYDLLKLTPPEPTIKTMSARDYLEGVRGIRDQRRKSAIEEAMRSGIDAKGDLDTEAMRKSLISQGFGEDADRVVREVSMARLGDVSTTFDVGTKLKAGVDAGIISPEVAQRAMGTTQSISKTPSQTRIDSSWMDGVPGQPITQSSEPSDGQTVRITGSTETMQPLYEYERTESKAQAVPEYSANLIDFAKKQNEESIGDIQTTGSGLKYTLPEGADKQYIIAAAKTLGYTGSSSEAIDSELTQRAMAQVAQPVLTPKGYGTKELLEARAEYAQKMAEYPALVAQKKAELIKQLEAGQATRFGQSTTKEQERRAERAQRVSLNPLDPTTNPALTREVTPAEYAVALQGSAGLRDMETAYQRYMENPSLANLVAFQIGKKKASGEPITQDAIASGILESGAVPKEQELLLKGAIQSTNVKDLLLGKGLDMTGLSFNPQAASKEYFEAQLLNQVGDIQDRGRKATAKDWLVGKKGDTKPPVAAPQTPPAKPSRRKASAEDF